MKHTTRQIIELLLAGDDTVSEAEAEAILGGRPTPPGGRRKKRCYSVREAAEILGVSYMSCYRLIQRGLLRSNRALRHHLIPGEAIDEFLDGAG